ncbi:MAG: hypothetical protein IJ466_01310 [Clostridia bacterium]|nr:hypothetical protein [Clostridia bacterium]
MQMQLRKRKSMIRNDEKDANKLPQRIKRMRCNPDLQALLGIPGFEKRIREIEHPAGWMDGTEDAVPVEEMFQLQVPINPQVLLEDLERILRIFDKAVLTRADWETLEAGFFDLLLVKYELYYRRMVCLGKEGEALRMKKRLIYTLERRFNEHVARRKSSRME